MTRRERRHGQEHRVENKHTGLGEEQFNACQSALVRGADSLMGTTYDGGESSAVAMKPRSPKAERIAADAKKKELEDAAVKKMSPADKKKYYQQAANNAWIKESEASLRSAETAKNWLITKKSVLVGKGAPESLISDVTAMIESFNNKIPILQEMINGKEVAPDASFSSKTWQQAKADLEGGVKTYSDPKDGLKGRAEKALKFFAKY